MYFGQEPVGQCVPVLHPIVGGRDHHDCVAIREQVHTISARTAAPVLKYGHTRDLLEFARPNSRVKSPYDLRRRRDLRVRESSCAQDEQRCQRHDAAHDLDGWTCCLDGRVTDSLTRSCMLAFSFRTRPSMRDAAVTRVWQGRRLAHRARISRRRDSAAHAVQLHRSRRSHERKGAWL